MAIDFPNSPTTGQTFTSDTRTWTFDGAKWNLTSYGPVGPQGATGATGATGGTGPTGPQGPPATFMGSWSSAITYSLGQAVYYNGSSYVSRVNSNVNNVPVSSPTQWGVLAVMGDTGPTGPQGFQGPAGGPQGPTGPQGAVGAQGVAGPQGVVGPQGAASTVPGPQGPTGPQGVAGPQGLTGPQGPQGPTGSVGTITLDSLNDVVVATPLEFQSIVYDGTNWVNGYASTVTWARNDEATTLTTGTVVYASGATGDHANVKRAAYTSDATSAKTIGVVAADIAAGQNGPIITRGYVDGIDLTAFTPGQTVYLSTSGGFTATKPSAPNHLVYVGITVRCTSNGILYVLTQNGYELDEIHDVSLPSPAAGDFLKYNGSLWVADDIDLGVDTSGILPVASGGTNSSATPTAGGVNYGTGTAHAFSGPGTSGQVLQSTGAGAPIWATYARGFIAQDTSTSGIYNSTTTGYVYTDLDITASVEIGRKYKWTVQGHVYTTGSPDIIRVGLLRSGAPLVAIDTLVNTTGTATAYTMTYYETATTTSIRCRVAVARATGSGTAVYHFADAARVASLTIEDVGI